MVLSRSGEGAGDATYLLKCLALHPICLKTFVVLKVCPSIYRLYPLWESRYSKVLCVQYLECLVLYSTCSAVQYLLCRTKSTVQYLLYSTYLILYTVLVVQYMQHLLYSIKSTLQYLLYSTYST